LGRRISELAAEKVVTRIRKQKLLLAGTCCASLTAAWLSLGTVDGSEFIGGRITGPLTTIADIGSNFLLLALLITFWYPRVAAAIMLAASVLCLPLYFYFTAPGPFRWIFKGEYSVPLQASFVWDTWAIAGMFTIAIAAYVCFRIFSQPQTSHDAPVIGTP
jgi:hypothetical protein